MLHSTLSYGLLAMLAIALLYAAKTDLAERRIANWLNVGIALAAPLFWYASGLELWPDIGIQLGLAAATFAVAAGFFALGQMGGGDVKLLAALALWFAPGPFLGIVVVMALLGYVLTMTYGALGVARTSGGSRHRDIAFLVGLGAMSVMMGAQVVGFAVVPLPDAVAVAAERSALVRLVMVQLPILAIALCTLLALRLFRRRQLVIETPYGVAIAGAGLLAIATQFSINSNFT